MKHKFILGYYTTFGNIIILILTLPVLDLVIKVGNVVSIIATSVYALLVIYVIAKSISYVYYKGKIDGIREGYELHYKQLEQLK